MTNFSGKPLSPKTGNAACGGPQGGGMDSRRNTGVAEISPKYLAEVASNAIPSGYKQTEVGVIPEDWEVKTVFELAGYQKSLFDDGDWIEAEHITSNGIRLIQTGNIGVGRYVEKDAKKYIFEESFEKLKCKELHEGDLLICRLAEPAGRACILPDIGEDKVITSVDVTIFRPSPELANREFYNQYFSSSDWFKSVLEQVGGTTHKRISRGALGRISVCYPNEKEQTAIANALSDVDALISELEKLIAKKQAIKTATMQQLLTGRTRLPQFALRDDGSLKGTKPSELGEIPEDWALKKIGEFTDCTAGGTPSTSISEYWGGTHPWMSSGELHLKRIFDVAERITDAGLENSSTKYIPVDSVLIGLAGQGKTRGTVAIAKISLCTNQSIASIFPSENHSTDYLYYNLDNRYEELRGLSTGDGGRGGLNLTIIRNLSLPYPDVEEQTAIATILSDMDEEIQALEQRLSKTRQIKQGMMQELLTGKTRLVQPLNKECQHG